MTRIRRGKTDTTRGSKLARTNGSLAHGLAERLPADVDEPVPKIRKRGIKWDGVRRVHHQPFRALALQPPPFLTRYRAIRCSLQSGPHFRKCEPDDHIFVVFVVSLRIVTGLFKTDVQIGVVLLDRAVIPAIEIRGILRLVVVLTITGLGEGSWIGDILVLS